MGKGEEDGADLLPLKLELKSHKSHFGSSLSQKKREKQYLIPKSSSDLN
jgi:hypothetical protein